MVTDPNVPPLPPHITLKQARGFMSARLGGQPEAKNVLANTTPELIVRSCLLSNSRDSKP
jgi:pyruvate dehydrogenase (quinone)